jgi:hypothetical protein
MKGIYRGVHSGDFSGNLIFGLEFLNWRFPAIFQRFQLDFKADFR